MPHSLFSGVDPAASTTGDSRPLSVWSRRQWLQTGVARTTALAAMGVGLWHSPLAHAELADLKEKGSLKVALYKSHLPFSDANRDGMTGVDAQLGRALAQRLQLGVQWLPFDAGENMNDDLRNMVWRGHYLGYGPADVMLQVPIDKYLIEKTPQVEFLAPYYRHELGWLSSEAVSNADLKTMSLEGMTLAAETGTAAAGALLGYGGGRYREAVRLENEGITAAQGVLSGKYALAYVTRAQAETALASSSQAPSAHSGAAQRHRFVAQALPGTPPGGWVVGLAIRAGQPQLAQALQQAMNSLREDGTLAQMYRQQGLQLTSP